MANKLNISSAKMNPWAQCQSEGCTWRRPEGSQTRDLAKHHARQLCHRVLVVTEDRTLYAGESGV